MNGKSDMKFKLRPAFALVAAGTFAVCAFLAACADAGVQQSFPANLTKVSFTEVKDSPETIRKYPFLKGYFPGPEDHEAPGDTKVSVAELNGGSLILRMDEGRTDCGLECNMSVFARTKDGYKGVKNLLANQPVYVQTCPTATSLITTESYGVAQWFYNGNRFAEKALTYPSLDKVPACRGHK